MKKILLFLLLATITIPSFSQRVTKSERIYRKSLTGETLQASIKLGEDGKYEEVLIILLAQDSRYQRITSFISLYSGEPSDMYLFLSMVESFYNANKDNNDVHTVIDGRNVSKTKIMGFSTIFITERDGGGYRTFSIGMIETFKEKLVKWCQKNNIEINTDISEDSMFKGSSDVNNTNSSDDTKQINSKADELKKLKQLLDEGVLTQEEFDTEKKKILAQ